MATLGFLPLWGYLALALLLQVTILGDRGVPSAGLHPHFTRATVIAARTAFLWLLVMIGIAWLR